MPTLSEIAAVSNKHFGWDLVSAGRFATDAYQNQSVLATNGRPPLNARQQEILTKATIDAWKKDNTVIDRFAADVQKNPTLYSKYKAMSPLEASSVFLEYSSNRNNLAASINRRSDPPAAPRSAAARPAAAPPRETPAPRRDAEPAKPAPVRPAAARPAATATDTVDRPSPVAAAASPGSDATAALRAAGDSNAPYTIDDAKNLVGTLGGAIKTIYGDEFSGDIDSLQRRMESDPTIARDIAAAVNADPDLKKQLMETGEKSLLAQYEALDNEEAKKGVRDAMRPFVKRFIEEPRNVVNKQFQDDMKSAATGGGLMAGINGFFKGIFGEGFDLQGIGNSIMSFLQPLIDMVGNLFTGFKASGGLSNILTMGNGEGMIGNAMSGLSFAQDLGQAINANEASINREGRAYDRNRDGKVSDGYEYGPDGKRVKETYTDKDGKQATRDKYDASKDDRIDVNGKKVFVVHGIDDGNIGDSVLRAYATKVDPATGQILRSEIINIGSDGKITKTDPDTGENLDNRRPAPVTPPAPSQQMQTLGAKGPEPAGGNLTPNMSTLGIGS